MKQSQLIKLAICFLSTVLLAGCVWGGYDGGYGQDRRDRGDQRDYQHHDHGEHEGDH